MGKSMPIQRDDLLAAAEHGILQHAQIEPLLVFLRQRHTQSVTRDAPKFNGTHVLYYLGGLLAISAASLFATLAVESMGMQVLLVISLIYAACATVAAIWFEKRGLGVPASLFATLAIALTPLTVFALQHILGFWSESGDTEHYRDYHMWIDWRWLVMELSTLFVGVLMLRRFRYPVLVLPIAVTLWYMGMDIVPALIMQADMFGSESWEFRKTISLVFGLCMLLVALVVDLRSKTSRDYAFWLYLFGLLTFCGALSMMGSGQLSGKLVYLALHFGLIFIGTVLARRTFTVFGGIGIMLVLGDLSWHMFANSFSFMVVLTLLGFSRIGAGIWWSKHEALISAKLRGILPQDLRKRLEARSS